MILLIEGLNMTGKSTLAAAIGEALDLPILKFNVPPPDAYRHFRDGLLEQYRRSRHFIIDRAHLSNYAYNGCLGGGVLSDRELGKFDHFMSVMECRLFLMGDAVEAVEARMRRRVDKGDGAETMTADKIAAVQVRFLDVYTMSRIDMKSIHRLPDFISADGKKTPFFRQTLDELDQALRKEP